MFIYYVQEETERVWQQQAVEGNVSVLHSFNRSNALFLKRTNQSVAAKHRGWHRHHHSLVRISATKPASEMLPRWMHDQCAWVDAHAMHRGSKCIRSPCQKNKQERKPSFVCRLEVPGLSHVTHRVLPHELHVFGTNLSPEPSGSTVHSSFSQSAASAGSAAQE